ncbi:hypothetical protein DXA09_00795 [Absiella sp. AM54-8XD]|nr:hypothetical protein DW271_00890 [Absiella sp. AM22-9]RGB60054.1 hypothetical protein DW120_10510 [Absiella sp. AM10-20]RGB63550.1 hypothetical protein DW113_17880 [Absiella sp. AM09-45]RGB72315.1 hypothetical protein DW114_18260 [Absiella sp. AM09-50]RGC26548.1 hypothetical protein DXA09_00795 [Absiella sp. AM54-8XD]RHU08177.1 hypothetical protein DW716_06875 [Absiella sp. AM27-20]DAY68676.1 MAG TPA: hypothetical protein [Caudoviricetes sp.]
MPISTIVELPISLFLLFRKNTWIYNQTRSEDGRKMLKDFWRLQQTEPDIEAIHRFQERGDKL